jgi:hypothetical protein
MFIVTPAAALFWFRLEAKNNLAELVGATLGRITLNQKNLKTTAQQVFFFQFDVESSRASVGSTKLKDNNIESKLPLIIGEDPHGGPGS